MDIEKILKRSSLAVPLLMAAGYFIFLSVMWAKYLEFQQVQTAKFDEALDAWKEAHAGLPGSADSSDDRDQLGEPVRDRRVVRGGGGGNAGVDGAPVERDTPADN